jgi:glycosyltransferase involved in cell wall biosynthesis
MDKNYTAVIRTFNSMPLLLSVIDALKQQTVPPDEIILVDSSNEKRQREDVLSLGYQVIRYPSDQEFNFSKAINIGVEKATTEYVLIISSHVVLNSKTLIEKCINITTTHDSNCLGYSIYPQESGNNKESFLKVDSRNFSPVIGLSNSCAFLKTINIVQRPFREDVFSAEDQEWVGYYLRNKNSFFYSIGSSDLLYLNENINIQKKINEEIAMAYFTHHQLRSPQNILLRALRGAFALLRNRPERAKYHWIVSKELLMTYFRKPYKKSRYF